MKIGRKNISAALLIGAIAGLTAFFLFKIEPFKSWELKAEDVMMTHPLRERPSPSNVAIFYVDEPSLKFMEGQGVGWPWPRELYASAIDFARRGGARAILFDLFYSEPSVYGVPDDTAFANGITGEPPVYFVLFLSENDKPQDAKGIPASAGMTSIEEVIMNKTAIPLDGALSAWAFRGKSLLSAPIAPLAERATGFGNAEAQPDTDGVYRRIALLSGLGDEPLPLVSFKIVSDIEAWKKISWPQKNVINADGLKIPLDEQGKLLINYYGGTGTFPVYSLAEIVLSDSQIKNGGVPQISPDVLKDKVVIIGVSAPGLYDMKSSPYSRVYPGAEVHATVIENLLSRDLLSPLSWPTAALFAVVSAIVAAILVSIANGTFGIIIFIALTLLASTAIAIVSFAGGQMFPVALPSASIILSSFITVGYRFMTEGKKKREIRRAFGQYLSPHVVKKISDDPASLKLGGELKDISVYFSDIADFTTISEKTAPEELVKELNEYFSSSTSIIQESGGTLDKYIGDAVMAFWGAPLDVPDHAAMAVISALKVQLAGSEKFKARIGIHTGKAVIGNIGSNVRFNYTAIGDTVNLASRLEGINKNYGTRIIISEETYRASENFVEARRIGCVRVKGRGKAVQIYEPLGEKGDFGPFNKAFVDQFALALDMFEGKKFAEAEKLFAKLARENDDAVSKRYEGLCAEYIKNPPEDFDGVATFKTK